MTRLAAIGALSAALITSASDARTSGACVPAADRAAVAAVVRTPALGQVTVSGSPYAIAPNALRVEVRVFGTQTLVYAVDVKLDSACRVLATSARLESRPR